LVTRGEIWLASPDPTVGSEIKKTRPWLIVSPPEIHDELRTVIAVPLTSGGRPAPYRISVHFQDKDGLVLLDQIRTLDRQRLIRPLGRLDPQKLSAGLAILCEMFSE
jgi:mRNA interferase MazF